MCSTVTCISEQTLHWYILMGLLYTCKLRTWKHHGPGIASTSLANNNRQKQYGVANLGPLVHPGSYRCEFPSQIISIATLLPPNGWSLTGVNNTLPGTCTTPQSMSLRWWKMVSEVIKHSHRQANWLRLQGKTTA